MDSTTVRSMAPLTKSKINKFGSQGKHIREIKPRYREQDPERWRHDLSVCILRAFP